MKRSFQILFVLVCIFFFADFIYRVSSVSEPTPADVYKEVSKLRADLSHLSEIEAQNELNLRNFENLTGQDAENFMLHSRQLVNENQKLLKELIEKVDKLHPK